MLTELKFVQGAVARKDLVPEMAHFRIANGVVRSFNGIVALSSPIAFDIDCAPKADQLVRAIGKCEETIQLSMTASRRLHVKSGKFNAYVDTLDSDAAVSVEPIGDVFELDGEQLMKAIEAANLFVGNDASRPWTNGMLLKGPSCFATNNVCLVEYWTGFDTPLELNIPGAAIREMLRVDEPPTHGQTDGRSVTFHYADGRWIRSQLLETTWPDLSRVLDNDCTPSPLPEYFFEGLDAIASFNDEAGRVYFKEGRIQTHADEGMGASYEIPGLNVPGIYHIKMLQLLSQNVQSADFSRYPKPTLFFGERFRGAITGLSL